MIVDPQELSREQIEFAVRCVAEWIGKRREIFHENPTAADAYHSSLLRRLLSGKPMLPDPPPKRFSYPDYELAEGKEVEISEIWERETTDQPDEGKVVIDQAAEWDWVDREAGLLRHRPTGHRYRTTTRESDDEPLSSAGPEVVLIPKMTKYLKKVADESF